jgi:phosphoglycerol transferase MdoB-like AlkP superfamily enzyme
MRPIRLTVGRRVRYADWALGDFFRLAKKEAFWKDTVFVVVADHGALYRSLL